MASKKRTETQPVSAARLCSSTVLLCTQAEGTRTVLTCEGFRLAAQFTPAAVTTASKKNSTSIDIVSVNRINQNLHSNVCIVNIRRVSKLFSDIRTKILTNRLNHCFVIFTIISPTSKIDHSSSGFASEFNVICGTNSPFATLSI